MWLWGSDREQRPSRHTRIDLVAEESNNGDRVPIQCKIYAADNLIVRADIESFLSASVKEGWFAERIIAWWNTYGDDSYGHSGTGFAEWGWPSSSWDRAATLIR